MKHTDLTCKFCKRSFLSKLGRPKTYCSTRCKNNDHLVSRTCLRCNTTFKQNEYQKVHKFCTVSCGQKWYAENRDQRKVKIEHRTCRYCPAIFKVVYSYGTGNKVCADCSTNKHKRGTIGARRQRSAVRRWYLRKHYGITSAEYDELLKKQNGLCAICKEPPSGNTLLHVDHDHRTGDVRGLLHPTCNMSLGFYEKYAHKISAFDAYLLRSSKN